MTPRDLLLLLFALFAAVGWGLFLWRLAVERRRRGATLTFASGSQGLRKGDRVRISGAARDQSNGDATVYHAHAGKMRVRRFP